MCWLLHSFTDNIRWIWRKNNFFFLFYNRSISDQIEITIIIIITTYRMAVHVLRVIVRKRFQMSRKALDITKKTKKKCINIFSATNVIRGGKKIQNTFKTARISCSINFILSEIIFFSKKKKLYIVGTKVFIYFFLIVFNLLWLHLKNITGLVKTEIPYGTLYYTHYCAERVFNAR